MSCCEPIALALIQFGHKRLRVVEALQARLLHKNASCRFLCGTIIIFTSESMNDLVQVRSSSWRVLRRPRTEALLREWFRKDYSDTREIAERLRSPRPRFPEKRPRHSRRGPHPGQRRCTARLSGSRKIDHIAPRCCLVARRTKLADLPSSSHFQASRQGRRWPASLCPFGKSILSVRPRFPHDAAIYSAVKKEGPLGFRV